jgi:ferredoxin-NADP reductase
MHNPIPHPAEGGSIVPDEYSVEVVSAYPVSETVLRLTVRCPLRFDAGMYMEFVLDGIDPPRPYSIASAPGLAGMACDDLQTFLITRHPTGASSKRLHADVRAGDTLKVRGPFGTLRVPAHTRGRILLLAAGTGIAPLLSIARQLLSRGYSDDIELYFSVRGREGVFLLDELHVLASRYANFTFRIFVTRCDDALPDHWGRGRITNDLRALGQELSGTLVVIAGSPSFVHDCAAHAREAGAGVDSILTESYEFRSPGESPAAPNLRKSVIIRPKR